MGLSETQVRDLYRRIGAECPADIAIATEKRQKYNAKVKILDGIAFASSGEARMYQVLKLREIAGAITNLRLQPWYTLLDGFTGSEGVKHRAIRYRADFAYTDADGMEVVADYKGKILPAFIDKAKLFRSRYPHLRLEIWSRESLKTLV